MLHAIELSAQNSLYICPPMAIDFVKALCVGIIAAIPVGPVLFLVVRNTTAMGTSAGVATGFGSALADMLYAAVAMFAIAFAQNFIDGHQGEISIVGGIIVAVLGAVIFDKRQVSPTEKNISAGPGKLFSCAVQAMGCVFSNVGALAFMFALLAFFGIEAGGTFSSPIWVMVGCVGLGELLYWVTASFLLSHLVRPSEKAMSLVSAVTGMFVCAFGVFLVIRGIIILFG